MKNSSNTPTLKLNITSAQQCHQEFDLLKSTLALDESEDNWQKIDEGIKRFTAAVRGGICDFPDDFLRRWKESDLVRPLVGAMSTERTRLSGSALDLLGSTSRLGSHWDSAIPFYIPTIIKLLGRASKIYVTRASIALNTLIRGTKSPAFIPFLLDGLSDKSVSLRVGCADALLCCLGGSPERDCDQLELINQPTVNREGLNRRIADIENAIKIGGRDRDPKVRAIFKRIWDLYQRQWPARAASLSQPFTPTIRRYLGLSKPSGSSQIAPNSQPTPSAAGPSQPNLGTKRLPPTASNDRRHLTSNHQLSSSKGSSNGHPKDPNRPQSAAANYSRPITGISHHKAASSDSHDFHLAASVPLPQDHLRRPNPLPIEPTISPSVLSLGENKPADPIIQAQQSTVTKRSNSTMRARPPARPQRVALPVPDSSAPVHRTATRAPFNPLSMPIQAAHETLPKPANNPTGKNGLAHVPQDSNLPHTAPIRAFKPARTASGSSQVAPNPPPTRSLPRRAVPTVPDLPPSTAETVNLGKSTKVHDQSVETLVCKPNSRKAFKPTKSKQDQPLVKPSAQTTSLPAPSSSALQKLPEALRIPALTPLPPSPENTPLVPLESGGSTSIPASTTISNTALAPTSAPAPASVPIQASLLAPLAPPLPVLIPTQPIVRSSTHTPNPIPRPHPVPLPPLPPVFDVARNICTRLPDDLIVPMSVPLPPSPNSPYLNYKSASFPKSKSTQSHWPQKNKTSSAATPRKAVSGTPRHKNVGAATPRTQRLVAGTPRNRLVAETPKAGSKLAESQLGTPESRDRSAASASSTAAKGNPRQLLVDFEHEDTIWIPAAPVLNRDLVELAPVFEFGGQAAGAAESGYEDDWESSEEEVEHEPDEKRLKLEQTPTQWDNGTCGMVDYSSSEEKSTPTKGSERSEDTVTLTQSRRDASIFHWDTASVDSSGEMDSALLSNRTVSCLKEQPLFLAGDVTVTDNSVEFLSGIRGQSTPAADSSPAHVRTLSLS